MRRVGSAHGQWKDGRSALFPNGVYVVYSSRNAIVKVGWSWGRSEKLSSLMHRFKTRYGNSFEDLKVIWAFPADSYDDKMYEDIFRAALIGAGCYPVNCRVTTEDLHAAYPELELIELLEQAKALRGGVA
jgi:hypothetical protein